MNQHGWRFTVWAAALVCATGLPATAQPPDAGAVVRQLSVEHADSLGDLCRAMDVELVRALPSWSDADVRWCLFGVPTEDERWRLLRRVEQLRDFVLAADPVVQERLREADAQNAMGIEDAVQMTEVLLPLARARALLLHGAAIDPVLGLQEESKRSFEEAIALAERTDSVSAWTDAERGLIISAAAVRLGQTELAIDGLRAVRDALRGQPLLAEQTPGLVPTQRALETLLVGLARTPSEAASSMPREEPDRERLRLRLAALAVERASNPEERSRLLRAESDRLASQALSLALDGELDDEHHRGEWVTPLQRLLAITGERGAEDLGGSAKTARLLLNARHITPADGGGRRVRQEFEGHDLGAMAPIGSVIELSVALRPAATPSDLVTVTRAAIDLHRLAPDALVTRDGLRRSAALLRLLLRDGIEAVSNEPEEQALTMDLLEILVERDDLGRSNLDILAMASLGSDRRWSSAMLQRTIEAGEMVADALLRTGADDEDAVWAASMVGMAMIDALARERLQTIFDDGVLGEDMYLSSILTMDALAERLFEIGGIRERELAGSMRSLRLIETQPGVSAHRLLVELPVRSELVADWLLDLLRARAALQAGATFTIESDGHRLGAGLFALHDVPQELDLRGSIPAVNDRWDGAGSALVAGAALVDTDPDFSRLSIRCLSAALHAGDPATLRGVLEVSVGASERLGHAQDRTWAMLISAESLLRLEDETGAFSTLRRVVQQIPVEERSSRAYWHASMRMLEILERQNQAGERSETIAREVRRLKLQQSWMAHRDLSERIEQIGARVGVVNGQR